MARKKNIILKIKMVVQTKTKGLKTHFLDSNNAHGWLKYVDQFDRILVYRL